MHRKWNSGLTPSSAIHAGILAGVLLLTFGCSSRPAVRFETTHCHVFADEATEAKRVAAVAEEARQFIVSQCPNLRDLPVEIWVRSDFDAVTSESVTGQHVQAWNIWLRLIGIHWIVVDRIEVAENAAASTVTHEMLHYLLDRSWQPLPLYLEEGLADWFGNQAPGTSSRSRRLAELNTAMYASGFTLHVEATGPDGQTKTFHSKLSAGYADLEEVHQLFLKSYGGDELERTAAYGLGYLLACRIVDRIGLSGLHRLCTNAATEGRDKLSLTEILDAAGASSPNDLDRLVEEELETQDLRTLLGRTLIHQGSPAHHLVRVLSKNHTDRQSLRQAAQNWTVRVQTLTGQHRFILSEDIRWSKMLDYFCERIDLPTAAEPSS